MVLRTVFKRHWELLQVFCKMSGDGKKIAFSFSKVKKPALVTKINTEPKDKKEYVDCFDGSKGKFSYKGNIRSDEVPKQELVIPMPSSKTSSDILRSRIEEKANKNLEENKSTKTEEEKSKENTSEQTSKNLEELAALEILRDVKNDHSNKDKDSKLIIETKEVPAQASEHDIDYDNIPVTEFGMALLRGMGWKPGQGIGKDPRIVEATSPNLRPKGLGLGAKINAEIKEDEKSSKKSKEKKKS